MKQITSDLYLMKMPQIDSRAPQVDVYFLKDEKLLIDAGPDNHPCYLKLQQDLKTLGVNLQDVSVVLTHHHPDHVGLLKYFPEETPVYADPGIRYYGTVAYLTAIEEQTRQLQVLGVPEHAIRQVKFQLQKRFLPFLKNVNFKALNRLPVSSIRIHRLRGHSPADIVFQKDNFFFGGDLILKGIYFNVLLDIDPVNQKLCLLNQEYEQSIKKILTTFKIQTWGPGHGDPMSSSSLIRINHKYQKLRQLIHQRIAQSFSFADYDSAIHEIYSYFPRLNDYFYLSDILTVIKWKRGCDISRNPVLFKADIPV